MAIVDIKLRNACKIGKLAVSDRIEGIKYYKNLFLSIWKELFDVDNMIDKKINKY